MNDVYERINCRACKGTDLHKFLDLGEMPIPNGFRDPYDKSPEIKYPLAVNVCKTCWMVQLTHVVSPEIMYKNYSYIPSTSKTMLEHFERLARGVIFKSKLAPDDLVLDIGSNDGTLLSFFKDNGHRVLGIDPASNLSQVARKKGINTIDDLFSSKLARELVDCKLKPKAITATNVFAHVDDLNDFCDGISALLHPDGFFVVEVPYLPDLICGNEFDTIYHEHLSYFSLTPLINLFRAHDLIIVDVEKILVHGGSVRVFAVKENRWYSQYESVGKTLQEETAFNHIETFDAFAGRVEAIRLGLMSTLDHIKAQDQRIIGYGAPAKGNVLLNYCGIGPDILDYIVDSIPQKQGKRTPGTSIPIESEWYLEVDDPDYALLLAWNFKEEILEKQKEFRANGGKFIIPIPNVSIE